MAIYGLINSHMFGQATEPGEYVDWSEPDYATAEEWRYLLGQTIPEYAADSPHMIIFLVESDNER